MTTTPSGLGSTAGVYKLCSLFRDHPDLHYRSIS